MKLVIESGITVDEAIDLLKMFFDEQCADYSYLKSKMNVYVDLKNDNRQICPNNEKEFVLSGKKVVDILENEQQNIFLAMLDRLHDDLQVLKRRCEIEEENISKDQKYLDTAEEKGRKKDRIEQRKGELQEHLKKRTELQRKSHIYECIIGEINEGKFERQVDVRTEKHYGRNRRVYEMTLSGQHDEFKWIYSNYHGLSIRSSKD